MAEIKKKVILSEKDLKELVAEKYGLEPGSCTVSVHKPVLTHDPRESNSATVTLEGKEKNKS